MKLSTAIRMGSLLSKERRNGYMSVDGCCALGAACDAVGLRGADGYGAPDWGSRLRELFPILTLSAPAPHSAYGSIFYAISALHHKGIMNRDEIADWVEQIENAQEKPQEVKSEVHALASH